jgi:c-di-AMP phosphodiesterase-like protein
MVSVVALLCAAGIAPAECTKDNAIDVIAMSQAPNELLCIQDSMMALASLAIQAAPNEYWKVVCVSGRERISIVAGRGAQDQVTAPVPK